eukprot:CAMPEP_0182548842 /NCGR_PEP_ID=MMETSP1323-20130603/39366_1 /TAXON_ID=236787 /ORGANISM="Florenciella parvula, Strain RCC1693" /LENGTH=55 /DNA_ID=CAMNT_0024760259 /DNA_START=40 /DNA_END=204 /DNA_ORIENTATION=-
MKPTLMTSSSPSVSPSRSTEIGVQPLPLCCTSRPLSPSMRGTLGPQMSTSSRPTE